ncbi:class I SAM-dependent methyltransferase [Breoghania sp. L-A4]|uniref:class I SAM-dependent methyltransferase n=1 Tax=Breoghania sp. L-A4 TaxID=2304600 RepID=UPI000E35B4DF|nr:class I SAM-dependent methyltransferase [Breoghania sp. L-A4]AXS40635.1 class I SAM-dependent methyltransferase [Breoghania sp. L-A4]
MKSNLKIGRRLKRAIRKFRSGIANTLIDKMARMSAPGFVFRFSAVTRNQMSVERRRVMREIVKRYFDRSISMIEIGTWFGEGSTSVWVEQLPEGSSLMLVDSWRPYLTELDSREGVLGYQAMDDLSFAAFHNTALRVLDYERQRPDLEICVVRARSAHFLDNLGEGFDFIYVDGSHYYDSVKADIVKAKRVANKTFSIICGDDYELHSNPELVALASRNKGKDWLGHEGGGFHPGVLLAISEEFGQVNMEDGFWWTFCRNGEFMADAGVPELEMSAS